MLPGATLFGVALVMVIVASLAFLLVRKPSLSFGGISTETPKLKTKSRKIKEETKKASKMHACPKYLGYLEEIPKNSRIPNECLTCSKMVECQGLNAFHREEAPEKAVKTIETVREPEKPLEQVKPQKIIEEREVPTAPQRHIHERPPGCLHFFGYLKNMPKNTLIPDECLRCSKIVECLYHTVLE
jgi:hypothetical protein